jgi:hypothetical protein
MTMYIRIYICIFEYTYVYSNIHKFDILGGANFEYAVTSNLAATDLVCTYVPRLLISISHDFYACTEFPRM